MKKLTSALVSLMLVLSFTACGNDEQSNNSENSVNDSSTSSSEATDESSSTAESASSSDAISEEALESEETEVISENADDTSEDHEEETESNDGKTLVVYYSATNNTAEVANIISDETGGELFEILPAEPYTAEDLDWTNENSRVCREHDNEDERNVELISASVADWESYDVVYIGYPIWWGIAAWPVDGFIEANDFTDKTVIPFCTSSSSDLGESGTLLEQMAGTGNWQEGKRFQSGASEDEVRSWVESLGM